MSESPEDDDGANEGPPRREVTREATGPVRLDENDVDPEYGDIAVCMCGLSDDRPFCDGSHRATDGERPGRRYKYVDGERHEVEVCYRDGDAAAGSEGEAGEREGR